MMTFSPYKKSILATCAALSLSFTALSPAFGLDKDTLMNRFQAATNSMSLKFSSNNVEINGNNAVMHDVVATPFIKNEELTKNNITIGDIYFDNISEEDGRYVVGQVRVSDFSANYIDEDLINVKGLSFNNLILSDQSSDDIFKNSLFYEDMKLKYVGFTLNKKVIFELNNAESHYSAFDKQTPLTFTSKIDSFKLYADATEDKNTIAVMKALGLEPLEGSSYGEGLWDIYGDGRFTVNESVIKINNAGTLKTSFSISGFTQKFLKAIEELQKKPQEETSNENSALSAMALALQLRIKDIKLRYEDASLINKVIAFQAQQRGIAPNDLKEVIKGIVPMLASQLKSPTFTKEVEVAAKAFIDNPQSIEITATPENEVSAASLMLLSAMGVEASAKIIDMLNIHIVANK